MAVTPEEWAEWVELREQLQQDYRDSTGQEPDEWDQEALADVAWARVKNRRCLSLEVLLNNERS